MATKKTHIHLDSHAILSIESHVDVKDVYHSSFTLSISVGKSEDIIAQLFYIHSLEDRLDYTFNKDLTLKNIREFSKTQVQGEGINQDLINSSVIDTIHRHYKEWLSTILDIKKQQKIS